MLRAWGEGDQSALEALTPVVYDELYRLARLRMLAERHGHLLQPSALVNEAFVRLIGSPQNWRDRAHFFAFSSHLMRQILVDFARNQKAGKRGSGAKHQGLEEAGDVAVTPGFQDFVDLDTALDELARLDERQARVVELRYFGGLDNNEIAAILGISDDTVLRDWRVARAWLLDRLRQT